MSKAFSANIHDPNHSVDDYDLYFNGEPIETGGGLQTAIIRKRVTADTSNIISIDLEQEFPADAKFLLKLMDTSTSSTSETLYAESVNNVGMYVHGSAVSQMGYIFSLNSTVLTVTSQNPTIPFKMTNTMYEVIVFYGG